MESGVPLKSPELPDVRAAAGFGRSRLSGSAHARSMPFPTWRYPAPGSNLMCRPLVRHSPGSHPAVVWGGAGSRTNGCSVTVSHYMQRGHRLGAIP
jgi:hypothetical protein